ncbi:S8 family serine peptidase [Ilumatobacter sp.]|uniref:S8 family serine peptidase n=1 Tax=Ilumatobacter sp. TaxID=1967498 RepID=UPI003B51AD43
METATVPGREWDDLSFGTDEEITFPSPERSSLRTVTPPARVTPSPDGEAPSRRAGTEPGRGANRWAVLASAAALVGGLLTLSTPAAPAPVVGDATGLVERIDVADVGAGSLYHVVDQIGARTLWQQGITGAGVNVAVIDTGVADVASLGDGKIVAAVDLTAEAGDPSTRFVDTNGHGTHMAGIIAGAQPGSDPATSAADPSAFLGVAPDAGIVSVKVSTRDGSTDQADVIAGIDWVVANADRLDIRVLNLSFNSGSPLSYRSDPVTAALERAWSAGIAVVAVAGNEGADSNGLASPGDDPYVIAVAGADTTDGVARIADFSSAGDGVRDPDLAAPGAHIESLRAPGSDADVNHSDTGYVDEVRFKGTGTSQSAAVVSGSLALLLEHRPDLTPDQAKALLTSTAAPLDGGRQLAGAGLVQVDAAAAAPTPDVVQTWPSARTHLPTDLRGVLDCSNGACWDGMSWDGMSWDGMSWDGMSWDGMSWDGMSWDGMSWDGMSWDGMSWDGMSWDGMSWDGMSWDGMSWDGMSWDGMSWDGMSWDGMSWDGMSWDGMSWDGMSWDGMSWDGMSWDGMSWDGMSWDGMSWDGMSWDGMSWDGMSWD